VDGVLDQFKMYLQEDGKSENTINSYLKHVEDYLKWFSESKGVEFKQLYNTNVKDYISYLKTVRKQKPATINAKINALMKFNEFLVQTGVQEGIVITNKEFQKVQQQYASLAKLELQDVEKFRQLVLESGNKRNFALVTLLAYAGLRISEALNLKLDDISIGTREIIVHEGKGNKTRTVLMNQKVKDALEEYLKERKSDSEYLFVSKQKKQLDRTTVNKIFADFSKKVRDDENFRITPHDLRHFYCSYALKIGMDVHEVANQAGHSNIHTTLLYTNPTKKEMLEKIDRM
jgi:integrase/recombinase XerD